MSEPTPVSIIIPCYNLGEYVGDAIESCLRQSYEDIEIIVVDDASTDNTVEVCKHYLDDLPGAITYIRNVENLHVSRSRNKGIAASSGRYIMCLDADDMLGGPDVVAMLASALDKDRLLDIVYGSMQVVEVNKMPPRIYTSGWPPQEFDYAAQLDGKDQVPTLSMYRRKVWERVGGYRVGYERVEDALFYTQAVALGFKPQKVTNAITLVYRLRDDSLSHRVSEREWHTLAPRKPQYTPYTYEPIKISVIVVVGKGEVQNTIDSVWSQTLPSWECHTIEDMGSDIILPPFVVRHFFDDDAENPLDEVMSKCKGRTHLVVGSGTILQQDFLELLWLAYENEGQSVCHYFFAGSDPELFDECTVDKEGKMACGTCGRRLTQYKGALASRSTAPLQAMPGTEEGKVLVEYIGEGSWPIRGPVTGEMYYFSKDSQHLIKSVWKADARLLLGTYDTNIQIYEGDLTLTPEPAGITR